MSACRALQAGFIFIKQLQEVLCWWGRWCCWDRESGLGDWGKADRG